jgi:hypothetical protein
MKRLTLIIAGLSAIAASPATAQSNSRYPHRDWGKVATLNMSVIDATTCILRVLNRGSTATLIPAEGGNDIDLKPGTILGTGAGDAWQTFKVRGENGKTTLRILYRHPLRIGANDAAVKKLQKRCLKVESISPNP